MIFSEREDVLANKFYERCDQDCKKLSVEDSIPSGSDIVYFIGTSHNYNVFNDIHMDVNTNLKSLLGVLENLKDFNGVFNFISSWFVYGKVNLPAKEEYCCNPKGFFSITKRAAEELLISYCETFGIRYRILRVSNVYGGSHAEDLKKHDALQFLVNQLKENIDIELYHGGDFYRDYIHIDDVCKAIFLCIKKASVNNIINIGNGEKVIFKDIINYAKKALNSKSKIVAIEPVKFHKIVQVKDFYMDTSKLTKIGYSKRISIEQWIKTIC